jgi:hypothetical protein
MSDRLNRYMRRSGRLASLRCGVSRPFCAEKIRDLCNSSLQLFAKRSHALGALVQGSGLRELRVSA